MKSFFMHSFFISAIAIVQSYVTFQLWLWFVVPLGVSAISFPQAVGLVLLVNILMGVRGVDIKAPPFDVAEYVATIGIYLLTLGLGYIASLFI